jgi:hypothetical protein
MGILINNPAASPEQSPSAKSDKSDSSSHAVINDRERYVVLVEDEGPEYDSREALRFRRGLLDPRAAVFRRSLLRSKDQSAWHVRCRVLGGGGEFFFPLEPSLNARRPVRRVFLNLRKHRRSAWTQRLPPNWRDIDIRIAFSNDFMDEMGINSPSHLRSELQDQLGRDEFDVHMGNLPVQEASFQSLMEPGGTGFRRRRRDEDVNGDLVCTGENSITTEIVHKSVTPQNIEVEFEYKFCLLRPRRGPGHAVDGTPTWHLDDVVVVIKAPSHLCILPAGAPDSTNVAATDLTTLTSERQAHDQHIEIYSPQRAHESSVLDHSRSRLADNTRQRVISELMGTDRSAARRQRPFDVHGGDWARRGGAFMASDSEVQLLVATTDEVFAADEAQSVSGSRVQDDDGAARARPRGGVYYTAALRLSPP